MLHLGRWIGALPRPGNGRCVLTLLGDTPSCPDNDSWRPCRFFVAGKEEQNAGYFYTRHAGRWQGARICIAWGHPPVLLCCARLESRCEFASNFTAARPLTSHMLLQVSSLSEEGGCVHEQMPEQCIPGSALGPCTPPMWTRGSNRPEKYAPGR